MTRGLNVTPSQVRQAGATMHTLSSNAETHGSGASGSLQRANAHLGKSSSPVASGLSKLATGVDKVFCGMFSQFVRVSRKAGDNLGETADRTSQTEHDIAQSFRRTGHHDDGRDRPTTTSPTGSPGEGSTRPSSTPGQHGKDAPTSETPSGHPGEGTTEPSSSTPGKHGKDAPSTTTPTDGGHTEPSSAPPEPKPKVAPAPDRLNSWLDKKGSAEVTQIRPNRTPPAQKHFGDEGHDQMYDIEQESHDYKGQGSAARPTNGGRFQTAFTKKGDKHSAVVMETYIAGGENKPKYTASDGFLHQWGAAHAGFDTPGNVGKKTSAIENHLDSNTSYPDRLPNKLPDSIYHQNISGDEPKAELSRIMGENETHHDLTDDELTEVLKTDNGKSVNNIVRTYNDVKGDTGGGLYGITGGAIGKDTSGNYHLKFDLGKK